MKNTSILLAVMVVVVVAGALFFSGGLTGLIYGQQQIACSDGVCSSEYVSYMSCSEVQQTRDAIAGGAYQDFIDFAKVCSSCMGFYNCQALGVREGDIICQEVPNIRAECSSGCTERGITIGQPFSSGSSSYSMSMPDRFHYRVNIYYSDAGCQLAADNSPPLKIKITNAASPPTPPADECQGVTCPDRCSGNVLLSNGRCSAGECDYTTTQCTFGCADAACKSILPPIIPPNENNTSGEAGWKVVNGFCSYVPAATIVTSTYDSQLNCELSGTSYLPLIVIGIVSLFMLAWVVIRRRK